MVVAEGRGSMHWRGPSARQAGDYGFVQSGSASAALAGPLCVQGQWPGVSRQNHLQLNALDDSMPDLQQLQVCLQPQLCSIVAAAGRS